MTRIGIIGAGNVGGTLGKRFKDAGHEVRWGVPDPGDPKYREIGATDVAGAAAGADVVILAVPWSAGEQAVRSAGSLAGKVVIDAMNPIAADFSGLVDLPGSSSAESVARWAQGASVVKAFNTIGSGIMANPRVSGGAATLLIAGDDAEAKETVSGLARGIGFDPVDAGPLSMARYLEAFAWVWITLAIKQGVGPDFAFQVTRR